MPSEERTSVVLTAEAQAIKQELSPVYGLKGLLSSALVLFNGLTPKEQKDLVAKVKKSKSQVEYDREVIKGFLQEIIATNPNQTDQRLAEDLLRKLAGSVEPKKRGRRAKP